MFAENAILAAFIMLPLLLLWGLVKFFRGGKSGKESGGTLRVIAGNLLILVFLFSLLLLGGEVYYRFIYDTTDSFGLTKTTQAWFKRHFKFNNAGLRDSQQSYQNRIPEGKTRRVTFIGDSFTAGHGVRDVEDRFANRVRAARPGWDVHVFGTNGWDTGHELAMLRELDPRYQLDHVVLVYCLNDISDAIPEWQAILARIYENNEPRHLFKHSYLLNMMHYRFMAASDPEVANYYDFTLDGYLGPIWRQQEGRLRELVGRVRARGGTVSVMTFPFLHTIGEDDSFEPVHRKLDGLWSSLGVPHLDLRPLYLEHADENLVVSRYDAHPNEYAHGLAADALLPFLDRAMGE